MDASYKAALAKAVEDWKDLARQEKEITVRKAQISKTIEALTALCSEVPDINSLSLSDAIRLMIFGTTEGLSVLGLRDRLKEFGYDLTRFKNPLASIHTAVNRMIESEELRRDQEEKVEAGENLEPPALLAPPSAVGSMADGYWKTVIEQMLEQRKEKK